MTIKYTVLTNIKRKEINMNYFKVTGLTGTAKHNVDGRCGSCGVE